MSMKCRIWSTVLLCGILWLGGCAKNDSSNAGAPAGDGEQGPTAVSVSPSAGRGPELTLSAVYSHPAGAAAVRETRLLINSSLDGRNACYVYYAANMKALLLVADQGTGSSRIPLDGSSSGSNSQCQVLASGSSVSTDGNLLTLSVAIKFAPSFKGDKKVFLYAEDQERRSFPLRQLGSWTVQANN